MCDKGINLMALADVLGHVNHLKCCVQMKVIVERHYDDFFFFFFFNLVKVSVDIMFFFPLSLWVQ